jgi:O-antigen/teichoic acid export membrane protein
LSLAVALAAALPVVHLWGYTGIAVEFTLLEVFRMAWMAMSVRIRFQIRAQVQLRQLWPGLGASAVAGLILAEALGVLPTTGPIPVIGMVAGAVVIYLLLLVLLGQLGKDQLLLAGALLQKRGS